MLPSCTNCSGFRFDYVLNCFWPNRLCDVTSQQGWLCALASIVVKRTDTVTICSRVLSTVCRSVLSLVSAHTVSAVCKLSKN